MHPLSLTVHHAWLPPGLMAIDINALAFEEGMGNLRPVHASFYQEHSEAVGVAVRLEKPRAAMTAEDWITEEVNLRCGLQLYPQLGLAVQPLSGVMAAGCSLIAELCGMFNTDRLGKAARTVAADPAIGTLILDIQSPGGYCAGVEEAAAAIQALPAQRKGFSTIAYTGRVCASAAAWISASCDRIYAAPSATLGSIGIISSITDSSRAWKDQGLDRTVFTDGKYKAMGTPGVPVTEDQKAFLAAGVAELSAAFKGYLTDRRGIAPDAMQGQTFTARTAPKGFCDGTQFSDLEELMAIVATGKL